jgi:hypothetical protein
VSIPVPYPCGRGWCIPPSYAPCHAIDSTSRGIRIPQGLVPCTSMLTPTKKKKVDQQGMGHNELTAFRLARLRLGALAVVDAELSMYVVVG